MEEIKRKEEMRRKGREESGEDRTRPFFHDGQDALQEGGK